MDPPKPDPGIPQLPPLPQFRKQLGFWKRFFGQKEAVTGLVLSSACLFLSLRILNDKKRIENAKTEWEKVNEEVGRRREESEKLAEENRGLRTAFESLRERVLEEVRLNGRKLPPLEKRVATIFSDVDSQKQTVPGEAGDQGESIIPPESY